MPPLPLEARLRRLRSWFSGQNDRPLLGFYLGSYYPLRRYPLGCRHLPSGPLHIPNLPVEPFLADSDNLHALHERAGGDLIWSAAPFFGLPWLEAALGCPVVADPENGCTRALPPPGFLAAPRVPAFSESNPVVAKMLEFARALSLHSAGRYPVGATLMRGVSDCLAALYGSEEMVLRMVESPAEIDSLVDQITEFWIAFGRALLANVPLFHGGTGAFFYGVWCPGRTIWLQEDAVAMLSPKLYERFILPADRRIADAFEHTVVHLHPSRFIPSRQLASTNVDVIELHIDAGGPPARALEPHYRAILEKKRLLIWGDLTAEDLEFVLTRLPYPGLAVEVVVQNEHEAAALWTQAMALLGHKA